MPIKLTKESMRGIFPKAPQAVIDAFVAKQELLTKAGINATKARMAYFFANIEHECAGFDPNHPTIKNLTESTAYTATRMAQVWPNRFRSAAEVEAKYGTSTGWQKKAFNDIYGSRMGNKPGTNDGSTYIGRGGPQWTGRDGYAALERLTRIPAVANPTMVSQFDLQPEVCTAFWRWKDMNRYADAGDFRACVKAWNGGYNGMADRLAKMAGNDPIIQRLEAVSAIAPSIPEPKKGPTKTEGGAVVVGTGGAIAGATWLGLGWAEIGLTAFIVAGLVVAAVALIRKFRS